MQNSIQILPNQPRKMTHINLCIHCEKMYFCYNTCANIHKHYCCAFQFFFFSFSFFFFLIFFCFWDLNVRDHGHTKKYQVLVSTPEQVIVCSSVCGKCRNRSQEKHSFRPAFSSVVKMTQVLYWAKSVKEIKTSESSIYVTFLKVI